MALIARNQVKLDEKYESELISLVLGLWQAGAHPQRLNKNANCFDAYKQNFTTTLSEEESWVQDYRVFLPLTPTIVDSTTTTVTNLIFPGDRFLRVDTELTGEFWAKVATKNLTKTAYKEETEEAVLEGSITGDVFFRTLFEGPFTKAEPIAGADIRIYPQAKDISTVNRVILLRKTGFELEESQLPYIKEAVDKLDAPVHKVGDETNTKNQVPKVNPYRNDEGGNIRYGAGHILYEAHVPSWKASDGTKFRNIIITISKTPSLLLRFTQLNSKRKANSIFHLPFERVTKGEVFGEGIVKPILGIQSSINTMAAIELIGGLLDNMGGVSYNWADRTTRQLAKYWKMRPFAKWPKTGQSQLEPIPRTNRRQFAREVFDWFSSQAYVLTNAQTVHSGVDTQPGFATIANQQMQAAQGRAGALARHWDNRYIQVIAFEVIENVFDQMFPIVGFDPQSGEPQRTKDDSAILFWFKQAGYSTEEIYMKFNDMRFMSVLATPPELTDIIPIGTRSVIERLQSQQAFRDSSITVSKTPSVQYTKWNEVCAQEWENSGVSNPEKFYYTEQEIAQISAEQQGQKGQQQPGQNQGQPQAQQPAGQNPQVAGAQ